MTLEGTALPPTGYRHPVVLVCGDGQAGLFGAVPAEPLAVRTTERGCYVRVPDLEQLPVVSAGLLGLRPEWARQLCVMWVVNAEEHNDTARLAGCVRGFCHQLALARQGAAALPLLLVSYVPAAQGAGPWFSWQAGTASPVVHEGAACAGLGDWQRQPLGVAEQARRLHASVHLNSAVQWLHQRVLPYFTTDTGQGPALACAITLVPGSPQQVPGNLWQQWLGDRAGLVRGENRLPERPAALPFPDVLMHLLPVSAGDSSKRRTRLIAVRVFAVAGLMALGISAWQNTVLARQVTDDLHRYTAVAQAPSRTDAALAQALAVLVEDATRLDNYRRQGAPWALGFGLYRGNELGPSVHTLIGTYRPVPTSPTSSAATTSVRLNSLSLFNSASAELKPHATKVLINALVGIKAQPGWLIVIAGHTDATGSPPHNLQLSRARATAVRDWMQRMGDIPDGCFAVQGFGASQPIASNDTPEGRKANRRVDIRLVPEVGACERSAVEPGSQRPSPVVTVQS